MPAPANYTSLKVSELRALCEERSIDTEGMLEKAEFVQALEVVSVSSSDNNIKPPAHAPQNSNYASMKISELKFLCKEKNMDISGFFEKGEFVRALEGTATAPAKKPTSSQTATVPKTPTRRNTEPSDVSDIGSKKDKSTPKRASMNASMNDSKGSSRRRASTMSMVASSMRKIVSKKSSESKKAQEVPKRTLPEDIPSPAVQKEVSVGMRKVKATTAPRRATTAPTKTNQTKPVLAQNRRASTADLPTSTSIVPISKAPSSPRISRKDRASKTGTKNNPTTQAAVALPGLADIPTSTSTTMTIAPSSPRASRKDRASKIGTKNNQTTQAAVALPGLMRKGTKRRNGVGPQTATPDFSNITFTHHDGNITSDDDGKGEPDSSDMGRKVRFSDNEESDRERKVCFSDNESDVEVERRSSLRASFLADRCSSNRRNRRTTRVRFSYITPTEPMEPLPEESDGSGLDDSSGHQSSSRRRSSTRSSDGEVGGSGRRRKSSVKKRSVRRSTMGGQAARMGRFSTRRRSRMAQRDRRRSTWEGDTSWMDAGEAWHNQNSTNYTATDVDKAFRQAPAHKWRTDIYQVGGTLPVTVWVGELREYRGRSIKKAIEKFNDNPHKYAALMYQTSMLTWAKSKQKYTFVMRVGEEFVTPQGVTDNKKEAWMTVRIHRFIQLPAVPNNELPECDEYTRKMTYKGQPLPPPILPGRGMGICDMPNLKIIGDIDPSDIEQGEVGNCWLLCAISALAEFDGAIKKLFRKTKDLDKMPLDDGRVNFYTITLYDLETWEEVDYVIDESLCASSTYPGHLLGAKPSIDGELWVPVLEKALAIHLGGWDEINGGQCTHAWAVMTGCKRQFLFTKNEKTGMFKCFGKYNNMTKDLRKHCNSPKKCNETWQVPWPEVGGGGNSNQEIDDDRMFQRMCAWDDYNYICCAGSKKLEEQVDSETSGIVNNHAYSVLACHPNVAGTGIDLIKVRNPWGSGAIENGDFDDNGPGWKLFPEIKAELKPVFADDGIFYLTKLEFFDLFDHVYLSCSNMTIFKED